MSVLSLHVIQELFVKAHGGKFQHDPEFPGNAIPRFDATGTNLHYCGGNKLWCNFLEYNLNVLDAQFGYGVPAPWHPECSVSTRDFRRWRLTVWYRALFTKATEKAK